MSRFNKETAYGYNDVNIVPEKTTRIKSRSEVSPYDDNEMLPIIASPMDSVVSIMNNRLFNSHKIYAVIPRTYSIETRCALMKSESNNVGTFISVSLNEAKNIFDSHIGSTREAEAAIDVISMLNTTKSKVRICIDIANGHMTELIKTISNIKSRFGEQVIIMSGNIANPRTYEEYESAGCDYVRVSIGSGEGCSTSTNTGVHYPIFSLLEEIFKLKKSINGKCKIIADGGVKTYGDIQKALIYADYVMIGGMLSTLVESAGPIQYGNFYWNFHGRKILRPIKTFFMNGKEVDTINWKKFKDGTVEYYKVFYGMSTKEAQAEIKKGNKIKDDKPLKPSEGMVKKLRINCSLREFEENETAYLKSMMSYVNAKTLDEVKDSYWIVKQSKTHN